MLNKWHVVANCVVSEDWKHLFRCQDETEAKRLAYYLNSVKYVG